METKSLISIMLFLQAIINGVNPAIPPNQQSTKCSKNGNLNSDELLKSRDKAFDGLYKSYGLPGPYTGDQVFSYLGIWAKALCPPKIKREECQECIKDTIPILKKNCPKQKEGATWSVLPRLYCMVRYADHPKQGNLASGVWARFYSSPSVPPTPATVDVLEKGVNSLANALTEKATGINNLERYGSGSVTYGGSNTLYGSMQCAPAISDVDCKKCLSDATNQIRDCCIKSRKQSGRVFSVNCAFWYSHVNFLPKTLPTNQY